MFTKVKKKEVSFATTRAKSTCDFCYSKPSKALIAIAHNLAPNKERRRKGNVSVL